MNYDSKIPSIVGQDIEPRTCKFCKNSCYGGCSGSCDSTKCKGDCFGSCKTSSRQYGEKGCGSYTALPISKIRKAFVSVI